jgi:RNA polymerase sigma-70 factor (ECF subfamily)
VNSRPPSAGSRHTDFEALYSRHSREVWAVVYARWLNAGVARNLAEDHAKSAFHRNGTHPPQTMNGVRAHDPLPLECLEREETFAQLRHELEQLSEADREILTLRYALDYNSNQIADLLDINPTAVHMRLSRARQRLADRLTAQKTVKHT